MRTRKVPMFSLLGIHDRPRECNEFAKTTTTPLGGSQKIMQIILLLQLLTVVCSVEWDWEEDLAHLRHVLSDLWIPTSHDGGPSTAMMEDEPTISTNLRHLRPKKQGAQKAKRCAGAAKRKGGCTPPILHLQTIPPTLLPPISPTNPPTAPRNDPPPTFPPTAPLTTLPPTLPPTPPPTTLPPTLPPTPPPTTLSPTSPPTTLPPTLPPTPPPTILPLTCANSIPITVRSGTTFGSVYPSIDGTLPSWNSECSGFFNSPHAWFSLIGTGELISISTCSSALNFDSAITVSSGSCDKQECISTGTLDHQCKSTTRSSQKVVMRTEADVTYFILIENMNGNVQGQFDITISTLDPPLNDLCSGALPIRLNEPPLVGSITNASNTYGGSELLCLVNDDSPSVWYVFVGTGDVVAVTTCSQELDFFSVLYVSQGSCDDLQCVTASWNDDLCSGNFNAARVVFHTEPDVNYFIVVKGSPTELGSQGKFSLTASTVDSVTNDVCSGAVTLEPDKSVIGTTIDATGDGSFCGLSMIQPSLWYTIIGADAVYELSTCSPELNFVSKITVISGSCSNYQCLIPGVTSNDPCPEAIGFGSATVSLRTQVGVTYYVIVESVDTRGDFRLSMKTIPPPPDTACSGAVTLQPNTPIRGAITTFFEETRACSSIEAYNLPGVWYTLQGTGAAYEITTCSAELNFRSAISVSSGTCLNQKCVVHSIMYDGVCPEAPYGFRALAARVVLQTTVDETYFIVVEALSSPLAGVFDLGVFPIPENDLCSNAILVPSDNSVVTGSTVHTTYTEGTVSCDPDDGYDRTQDVWYRVKGTGGYLTASLVDPATTFDTRIAIYASDPSVDGCDQSCIAFNEDANYDEGIYTSKVSWSTEVGLDYYIRVYGWDGSIGPFALRVSPILSV